MKNISKILNSLGIQTNKPELYKQALTHSSYANEHQEKSNERLEFLGDAVLELLTSNYLYNKYSCKPEGWLTKERSKIVCEEALIIYSKEIGLKELILIGRSEQIQNGPTGAIIADCFEAILGAIYLDKGYSFCEKIYNRLVVPFIVKSTKITDYKTTLQEIMMINRRILKYKILSEKGPAHNKQFEAGIYLDDLVLIGKGTGKSKKEAEQNAAKAVLEKGEYHDSQKIVWKIPRRN